jgi:hypothetical protein
MWLKDWKPGGSAMADRALYYPYIHIRDIEWLKGTLLLFEQVRRMTPVPGRQVDDGPIDSFTAQRNGKAPLVDSVNLFSPRAIEAQVKLAMRLGDDAKYENFRQRFGRSAAEEMRGVLNHGFQIHQAKLDERLKDVLRETHLAWEPGNPEPYDRFAEYVELHPRVAEAVMATLAIACAAGEGLDIVGDQRSGALHDCLVRRQLDDVYTAWLGPSDKIPDPPQPTARELFEFVVTFACDTTKLDADALANMGENREPIRRLMSALAKRANEMEALDPGEDRTQQFKDEMAEILREWKNDRANMQNYWKKFFGIGIADVGGTFLESVISKALEASPVAASGALAGLALQGPVLAAGAGLGIGLFTHGAKTYADLRSTDRQSSYRYLTTMEKAGVVVRADLRN